MTPAEQLERVERPLRHLFRTVRPVVPVAGSSAALLESAIRSAVETRLLAVVAGDAGERVACIAEACGKDVVRAVTPPGRTLEPAHLDRFLGGPEIDAVSIVHAEPGGVPAPLEALARVIHTRPDVLVLVDATWSLGAHPLEFDLWQLDFACTASEQTLGLPGGPALGAASKRLLARAAARRDRGWALDLVRLVDGVRDRTLDIGGLRLEELERHLESRAAERAGAAPFV